MFGAGTTGENELLLESLASAMSTDSSIAGSDARFLPERFERILCKVYFTDDLAVCRL